MKPARLVLALSALVYALFFFWYGGSSDPLTPAEADAILDEIKAGAEAATGTYDSHLIESFRVLTRHDDGREYYMLNLMRFREKALYPEGSPYGDDAIEAANRYNAVVIPALLKRGSLPILLGSYAGPFIPSTDAADKWDQIGIVRYRSRRDMLDMARELSATGGGQHKWASIEKTVVFPVSPIFDLVFVRGFVFVIIFGTGSAVAAVLRRRTN